MLVPLTQEPNSGSEIGFTHDNRRLRRIRGRRAPDNADFVLIQTARLPSRSPHTATLAFDDHRSCGPLAAVGHDLRAAAGRRPLQQLGAHGFQR
jgi:hypothetical protein